MKISIIVPSCGRPKILENCLKSLKKIEPIEETIETIAVINDDNPANINQYTKIINKYRKDLNIKSLIFQKRIGSVRARNEGIKKAEGKLIFFFDDDIKILPDYFKKILPLFKGKVGAVGGAEIKKKSSILHNIWFSIRKIRSITNDGDVVSNFFYDPQSKEVFEVDHLHGSNFGIKREVLKKVKGFDENFYGVYRDETDFIYRIRKAGYKILFLPSTGVIHKQTVKGGNVPPKEKKKWAYWYHRNNSYFFFKNVYTGNFFYFLLFLFREFFYSILKAIVYRNAYFIIQYPKIIEGYQLAKNRKFKKK
ncbi:MAG: glycosyltransferase family 2 protein [Candidatus Aenigmatarchaeota archaeon]